MLAGPRAQIFFALSALLSPALCAAVDDPASRTPAERPFIGLLLPLNAPDFARAAEAVRLGCQAALVFSENRQVMRVLRTDARPESILAEYEAAVQSGAAVIVGPLTRSGVSALAAAGRVSVATLAINDGKTGPLVNSDLNGIRFVDMPWLVQPDHAAVMVYPRLEGFSTELQRFYALGIDSCRIAGELLSGQQRVSLDGVTGKISYHGGNALEREPVQAVFRDGVGVSTEDSR